MSTDEIEETHVFLKKIPMTAAWNYKCSGLLDG